MQQATAEAACHGIRTPSKHIVWACAEERPSAAEALQHPYFTAASAGDYETAAQQLRAEVAGAAAFADAERQQRRAELAAFEQELAALSS